MKKTYLQLLKNLWSITISILTKPNYWIETWYDIKHFGRALIGVLGQFFSFVLWLVIFIIAPVSLPILAGISYLNQDREINKRNAHRKKVIDRMRPNRPDEKEKIKMKNYT